MVKLAENGKHRAAVVYSPSLDATDASAVSDYCLFMKRCVGKTQPAYAYEPKGFDTFVYIGGQNEFAARRGIKVPRDKFEDDTVYICVKDNYVILDGGARGKLYAVYEFLERFLNVRFYAPLQYRTPRATNVCLQECEILYTPKLRMREIYAPDMRWDNAFFVKLRSNAEEYALSTRNYGGSVTWGLPRVHTVFDRLMPPEDAQTGIEKHPEYFSFVKAQNKRVGRHHTELGFLWGEGDVCWSNPEVVDIVTERVKQWILEQSDREIFSISQNDWEEHCECPACEKTALQYGENGEPHWSAPLLIAVNEIAKRIKAWQKTDERVKHRKIVIDTLAYRYTMLPPVGFTAEDNVMVRLCTHTCCMTHPYRDKTCPVNNEFIRAIEGWKKTVQQLYIWDYPSDATFHLAFDTILPNMQDNMRYFTENNVVGIFSEFNDLEYTYTGRFPQVRQYLLAKLMWNPDLDFETEYREAMEFFYEDAAPCIMEIERRFYENVAQKEDYHAEVGNAILPATYSPAFLETATQLYELALAKARTAEIALRIRRDYVCLKFIKMYLHKGEDYKLMQAVLDEMDELGVTHPKDKWFRNHFFGGRQDDLFRPEIEERNTRRHKERVETLRKAMRQ